MNKLTIIRGKGTDKEKRIETNIDVYPIRRKGRVIWVTIPKE
jgi:hypothetical protein